MALAPSGQMSDPHNDQRSQQHVPIMKDLARNAAASSRCLPTILKQTDERSLFKLLPYASRRRHSLRSGDPRRGVDKNPHPRRGPCASTLHVNRHVERAEKLEVQCFSKSRIKYLRKKVLFQISTKVSDTKTMWAIMSDSSFSGRGGWGVTVTGGLYSRYKSFTQIAPAHTQKRWSLLTRCSARPARPPPLSSATWALPPRSSLPVSPDILFDPIFAARVVSKLWSAAMRKAASWKLVQHAGYMHRAALLADRKSTQGQQPSTSCA